MERGKRRRQRIVRGTKYRMTRRQGKNEEGGRRKEEGGEEGGSREEEGREEGAGRKEKGAGRKEKISPTPALPCCWLDL